jgi:hypothetical protein
MHWRPPPAHARTRNPGNAGLPAITFFGLTPDGEAPDWHQLTDTPDKMNPDVLWRTYQFTQLFIDQIDLAA